MVISNDARIFILGVSFGYSKENLLRVQSHMFYAAHSVTHFDRELISRLLVKTAEHDRPTALHMLRVGGMCALLAMKLGVNERSAETLFWATLTHDIGKLRIPAFVLNKSSSLDDAEWQMVRQHPEI